MFKTSMPYRKYTYNLYFHIKVHLIEFITKSKFYELNHPQSNIGCLEFLKKIPYLKQNETYSVPIFHNIFFLQLLVCESVYKIEYIQ